MFSLQTSPRIAQAVPFSQFTLSVSPAWIENYHFMVETRGSATQGKLLENEFGCTTDKNMPLPPFLLLYMINGTLLA